MGKLSLTPMPGRHAAGTITALITTIIVTLVVSIAQIMFTWTPLQCYYLPDLGTYAFAQVLHLPSTEHRLVGVVLDNGATDFARDSDFVQGQMQGADKNSFPFALSDQARREHRIRIFMGKKAPYVTKSLGQLFRLTAFPSLTPKQFALLPAGSGLVTLGWVYGWPSPGTGSGPEPGDSVGVFAGLNS
jgi:hypothetical protein